MSNRLQSYLEILQFKSEELGVSLLDAFKWKDIADSTYYRTMKGDTELRYETARLVNHALHELHALRAHREALKKSKAG
jgi:predicted transcriptional regulator